MKLTDRLQKIVNLVESEEGTIADVGTDHGLIPIALAYKFPNRKIYAMDVREGPLSKAKENAKAYQVDNRIEFKLSDGLQACFGESIQTVIITGMGGLLIQEILEKGKSCYSDKSELILSPHSDEDVVRKTLHQLGFKIEQEYYIKEHGKIYLLIYAKNGKDIPYKECEYLFGKTVKTRDQALQKESRIKGLKKFKKIYEHLKEIEKVSEEIELKKEKIQREIIELQDLIMENI